MNAESGGLAFVTLSGLVTYGETVARRSTAPAVDGVLLPPVPTQRPDRTARAREALDRIRLFADTAQQGFADAAAYQTARRAFLDEACGGDAIVFFAAWNQAVAEGTLASLLLAPIATVRKPI